MCQTKALKIVGSNGKKVGSTGASTLKEVELNTLNMQAGKQVLNVLEQLGSWFYCATEIEEENASNGGHYCCPHIASMIEVLYHNETGHALGFVLQGPYDDYECINGPCMVFFNVKSFPGKWVYHIGQPTIAHIAQVKGALNTLGLAYEKDC